MFVFFNPMYMKLYPRLVPRLGKIGIAFLDVFVAYPLLYFPSYYFIETQFEAAAVELNICLASWEKYKLNIAKDTRDMACVFLLLNLLSMQAAARYRGYVIAVGGYAWSIYLSSTKQ